MFLRAVTDRSLFKSEGRWEREKQAKYLLPMVLQKQQHIPREAQQWGYQRETLTLARPMLCISPAEDLVPESSYFPEHPLLPCFPTRVCPVWRCRGCSTPVLPKAPSVPAAQRFSSPSSAGAAAQNQSRRDEHYSRRGRNITNLLQRAAAAEV